MPSTSGPVPSAITATVTVVEHDGNDFTYVNGVVTNHSKTAKDIAIDLKGSNGATLTTYADDVLAGQTAGFFDELHGNVAKVSIVRTTTTESKAVPVHAVVTVTGYDNSDPTMTEISGTIKNTGTTKMTLVAEMQFSDKRVDQVGADDVLPGQTATWTDVIDGHVTVARVLRVVEG